MKPKSRISRISLKVITSLFIFIAISIFNSCNNPDFHITGVKTAPDEYWNLFPKNIRKDLAVSFTLTPKDRGLISQFTFDHDKYFIDVFKIDTIGNKSISDMITLSDINNLKIDGVPYFNLGGNLFEVNYRTSRHKASKINLNLFGGPIATSIKNDTIASYYSEFKIFSVTYDKSDTTAIWAMTEGKYPELPKASFPINIVFLKKHNILYFLTMSVNDPTVILEPNKLYNLLATPTSKAF